MARRAVALCLLCIAVVGVSACGSSDDGTDGAADSAEKISGTVTVWDSFYKTFPNHTKAYDKLDAEFERMHPGVTIEHVGHPFAEYDKLLQAAFTAGETPDVVQIRGPQAPLRWARGLEPLNDRISEEQREAVPEWAWRAVTEGFGEEGDIYGLPIGASSYAIYYNKKLFAKAGLPTDFQPKTWEEVKEAGLKLKAAGIQPFTGGNQEGIENIWWFSAVWPTITSPEDTLALAKGELPLTDPKVAETFKVHMMLQDAGLFEDDRFSTPLYTDGIYRFGQGKAGMALGFITRQGSYVDHVPELGEENVGLFFPPGANYLTLTPPYVWSIPRAAKNKEAASAYLEFVTSREGIETTYKVGGEYPNRSGVEIRPDAPVQERLIFDRIRSAEDSSLEPGYMGPAELGQAILAEIGEVLQGRKSLEDAQQELQKAMDRSSNALVD
jgi:ABC-type glycerol-3-phosphate transport system substrate-binding protein